MATFNRINRLRYFRVLRSHIGEEDAEAFTDALEDDLAPLATTDDLQTLRNDIRHDQQTMLIWVTGIWTALLAAAVAIAQLF